jgi:methylthioribulose-1-phosphate dehydratase
LAKDTLHGTTSIGRGSQHWRAVATLLRRMIHDTDTLQSEVEMLCAAAHWCYARGWVPATSGNFSVRAGVHILITPTGLDKGRLTAADLLEIDPEGRAIAGRGRPSAETSLHTVIYHAHPEARAILHVHTIWNTLLSGRFVSAGCVPLAGYELLKGLSGVVTHTHQERVPIIENSQDYEQLAANLASTLAENSQAHGVLLSRHGLYTWGETVTEARRHLEVLEFLLEVEGRRLFGQHA